VSYDAKLYGDDLMEKTGP